MEKGRAGKGTRGGHVQAFHEFESAGLFCRRYRHHESAVKTLARGARHQCSAAALKASCGNMPVVKQLRRFVKSWRINAYARVDVRRRAATWISYGQPLYFLRVNPVEDTVIMSLHTISAPPRAPVVQERFRSEQQAPSEIEFPPSCGWRQ